MMKTSRDRKDSEICAAPSESTPEKPNLNGDWSNFFLLIILYTIQGFPKGLSHAFPIILQSRKMVTYTDQATFSVSEWPLWLKIVWAPIIDAVYVQRIGRRKSWLLPIQMSMSLSLLYMAHNIDDWLPESGKPNLTMLTSLVFIITALTSTQDIVVDGWALTMLKKRNIAYASTCNFVGVILGLMLGSVCFILMTSEEFANTFIRASHATGGLMTTKNYLYSWGVIILMVSFLVGIFKKEKDNSSEDGYAKRNILQTYKLLWDIIKLPHFRTFSIALLTVLIGFDAMKPAVLSLKLIDAGVPKEDCMFIHTIALLLTIAAIPIISKYDFSLKPMSYLIKITPFGFLWAITYGVLIYYTPSLIRKNELTSTPVYYYFILGTITSAYEVIFIFTGILIFAFMCRLSDPNFGCTYMTFYNTVFNLGLTVSTTVAIKLLDILTFNKCSNDNSNTCSSSQFKTSCEKNEGSCEVYVDGYYILIIICMTIGFVWFGIFRNILRDYQTWSLSRWLPNAKRNNDALQENELHLMLSTS